MVIKKSLQVNMINLEIYHKMTYQSIIIIIRNEITRNAHFWHDHTGNSIWAHQLTLSIAASFRILGRHNIPECCFQWISTLSGPTLLLRADLPMIWYSDCSMCLVQRAGIAVSMLYYAFCWHQTDLQSSFIIHGHRLSASQSTKWPRGPDREWERENLS